MLYPIELLRQFTRTTQGVACRTASMVTAMRGFVMSSVGFLAVSTY